MHDHCGTEAGGRVVGRAGGQSGLGRDEAMCGLESHPLHMSNPMVHQVRHWYTNIDSDVISTLISIISALSISNLTLMLVLVKVKRLSVANIRRCLGNC